MTQRDGLVESRMLGDRHVRFGGRAGETDQPKGWHRAPARPDDDTGYDAAADLIERAMSTLAPCTAEPQPSGADEPTGRDLLADLVAVLGDQRVPAADVPALLRDLAPDWEPYRSLSGTGLRELLERDHGYRVPSTKNRYPIDPTTVRDLIARQTAGGTDGTNTGAPGTDSRGVRSRWNVAEPPHGHDHGPSEGGWNG